MSDYTSKTIVIAQFNVQNTLVHTCLSSRCSPTLCTEQDKCTMSDYTSKTCNLHSKQMKKKNLMQHFILKQNKVKIIVISQFNLQNTLVHTCFACLYSLLFFSFCCLLFLLVILLLVLLLLPLCLLVLPSPPHFLYFSVNVFNFSSKHFNLLPWFSSKNSILFELTLMLCEFVSIFNSAFLLKA